MSGWTLTKSNVQITILHHVLEILIATCRSLVLSGVEADPSYRVESTKKLCKLFIKS